MKVFKILNSYPILQLEPLSLSCYLRGKSELTHLNEKVKVANSSIKNDRD